MKNRKVTQEMITLVPELEEWGDAEIGIEDWIAGAGNYSLAIGYSRIFWPRIVKFGDYVLREDSADAEAVASWEQATHGDKKSIEAVLNHVHIADIHTGDHDAFNEAQLIELGRTLKEIYEAKLARLFPDLTFEVVFNDAPGQDPIEYQVTFWTVR